MPAGRPTKYKPEMLERGLTYLSEWKAEGRMIPSIVGLALYLDVPRKTLYRWKENNKGFSDLMDKIEIMQEQELISGGLSNKMNSTIAKLVLTKHGYSDKQDVKQEGTTKVVVSKADADTF